MAEGTYEYECMRAELLGIAKPDEEEFERLRAERLELEHEEKEAAEAALLDQQEEALQNTGGKLDELNSILSSTQQKLNRFKQTACGSFSHIFNRGSMDLADTPTTSATASRRNTTASGTSSNHEDIGNTHDSDEMTQQEAQQGDTEVQPIISTEKIRNAKLDVQKKMSSHLDKLDSLINKAENAELSMSEQTKQMRKMAK